MATISISKEDYEAVVELASKMQQVLKRRVSLGIAASHACRYVLSETKRVERSLIEREVK